MQKSSLINILIILSLAGILTSAYLLKLHYSQNPDAFCNLSSSINCDIVNKSQYALFPPEYGVPVALLGLLNFLILLMAAIRLKSGKKFSLLGETIDSLVLAEFIYYVLLANLLFAFYLIYIEAFVLYAFCILCVLLDVIIFLSLFFAYRLKKSMKALNN